MLPKSTKVYRLTRRQFVPRAIGDVFEFFSRPENLESITPPWLRFRITHAPGQLRKNSLIRYALRIRAVPVLWITEIREWNPPHGFVDVQIQGPYTLWHHEHKFRSQHDGTWIEDDVHYSLPFGLLGQAVHWALVERDLRTIFDYRGRRMQELFGSEGHVSRA